MKIFILLAIIFFSWRVFSEDGFYYEGRYYKIDEYIRYQEDPQYQAFLNAKRVEAQKQKASVEEYFAEKEKSAALQEKNRREYAQSLMNRPTDEELLKQDAKHEEELEAERKRQNLLQAQYLAQKDAEEIKSQPRRAIASVFEPEEHPMKRVPREQRKFVPKAKTSKSLRK
jgi:hypothetical protein